MSILSTDPNFLRATTQKAERNNLKESISFQDVKKGKKATVMELQKFIITRSSRKKWKIYPINFLFTMEVYE